MSWWQERLQLLWKPKLYPLQGSHSPGSNLGGESGNRGAISICAAAPSIIFVDTKTFISIKYAWPWQTLTGLIFFFSLPPPKLLGFPLCVQLQRQRWCAGSDNLVVKVKSSSWQRSWMSELFGEGCVGKFKRRSSPRSTSSTFCADTCWSLVSGSFTRALLVGSFIDMSISNLAFSHFESRQTNRRARRMAVLEFQSFVYTNWIFESQIKCSIKPGEVIKIANREWLPEHVGSSLNVGQDNSLAGAAREATRWRMESL